MSDNKPGDITNFTQGITRKQRASETKTNKAVNAIQRTRKATMAAAVAFAASAGPFALSITSDGRITVDELTFAGVVSLGFAVAAWMGTWAVPNAEE